jgi:precorrin-2 dehydrogenase/sirohydrochlorin ferrochelatase
MLYPVNIELQDLEITIIGGGEIAYRKCINFLHFEKTLKVVSNNFIDKFDELKGKIEMIKDTYKEEYIKNSFIVVAATNDKEVNKIIAIYCRENSKLVNVVDNIKLSNFTVPSCIKRGDLLISVSTGGKSPSLSSRIKKELEEAYDDSYEEYINLLGQIRKEIINNNEDISLRKKKLNELINLNLEELKLIVK